MTKVREARFETMKSKPEKRDIMTEMFEHFGIKVIDVDVEIPKPSKKKRN